MPATTWAQMQTGKDILSSSDRIHVIVKAVNEYLIKDERITGGGRDYGQRLGQLHV